MRLISLNWNYNKGEGSVSYSKIFNEAHIVVQLDMLQDCIADLTDKYAALLTPSSIGAKNMKEEHMTDVDYRAMYLKVRDELAELQQREWVGLTVEEMNEITWGKTIYEILELFEAKLKEKNT